jgi:hypothetical protein
MAQPGANSPRSPRRVRAAQRRREALELRMAGATYQDIGEVLGVSKTRAIKAVQEALRELQDLTVEKAEELRSTELARLERLQRVVWQRAIGTADQPASDKAVWRVLQIMERRAKLLGLDQPVKVEQTGGPMEIRIVRVDEVGGEMA